MSRLTILFFFFYWNVIIIASVCVSYKIRYLMQIDTDKYRKINDMKNKDGVSKTMNLLMVAGIGATVRTTHQMAVDATSVLRGGGACVIP